MVHQSCSSSMVAIQQRFPTLPGIQTSRGLYAPYPKTISYRYVPWFFCPIYNFFKVWQMAENIYNDEEQESNPNELE